MAHGRGFSIHRMAPASRRGIVLVAGLAMAVSVLGLPAAAHTPEWGLDPTVTLTVTPSDRVLDGESVTVTGLGFPVFTDGVIRQCGGTVLAPQCDPRIVGQFKTASTSHLPPTLVVARRYIDTGTTTFNCGVQACAFVATAGDKTSQHHISILGAGTSSVPDGPTSTSPTTSATTVPTQTTVITATTIPTDTTIPTATTTTVPQAGLLCDLLGALRLALGDFLAGLLDGLLDLLNCPPAG